MFCDLVTDLTGGKISNFFLSLIHFCVTFGIFLGGSLFFCTLKHSDQLHFRGDPVGTPLH